MKDISGFEGRYAVTEDGRVWSHVSNRFLKPMVNLHGYLIVELRGDSKKKKRYPKQIHRLVAETFLPNSHGLDFVNHKNSQRNDARVENLEWVTRKQNMEYMVAMGRSNFGEKSPVHILNENQVIEIRSKYKFWKYTMKMLGEEYGVAPQTIQSVLNRSSWSHI